jgi:hypothetical protein
MSQTVAAATHRARRHGDQALLNELTRVEPHGASSLPI